MHKYLDEIGQAYFWSKLKALFSSKVDKEDGKGLSANDFTDEQKTKLEGLGDGDYVLPPASATVLGGIKVGSGLSMADSVLSVQSITNEEIDEICKDE